METKIFKKSAKEMVLLEKERGWILALGITFVILGIIAFSVPVAGTIGLTFALACLLTAGGVIRLIHALQLRHKSGRATRFFLASISLVTGGLMFFYPEGGLLGVALALSFYFFMGAATQWIVFYSEPPGTPGRGWGLANAVASFLLGTYIVMAFPFSALWVPGLLLGIDLIITGSGLLGLFVGARWLETNDEKGPAQPVGGTRI